MQGLLIGLDLSEPKAADVVVAAQDAGYIVNAPTPDRIRLAPPLVLTDADADGAPRCLAQHSRRGRMGGP